MKTVSLLMNQHSLLVQPYPAQRLACEEAAMTGRRPLYLTLPMQWAPHLGHPVKRTSSACCYVQHRFHLPEFRSESPGKPVCALSSKDVVL